MEDEVKREGGKKGSFTYNTMPVPTNYKNFRVTIESYKFFNVILINLNTSFRIQAVREIKQDV